MRRAGARDFVPENTDGEHLGVVSLAPTFHFIPKLFVRPGYLGPGVGRL
ncbi:MAG: hypothetical protein AABX40_01465 [Candidatus Hydrothermarchaeota archaeon]